MSAGPHPEPAGLAQSPVAGIVRSHRGVPDVAWNAAVSGGVLVYRSFFPSIDGPPSWQVYGGTSAASPQVATVTAIGNQAREARSEKPSGELNPVIYSGTFNRGAAFNDVVPHTHGRAASRATASSERFPWSGQAKT